MGSARDAVFGAAAGSESIVVASLILLIVIEARGIPVLCEPNASGADTARGYSCTRAESPRLVGCNCDRSAAESQGFPHRLCHARRPDQGPLVVCLGTLLRMATSFGYWASESRLELEAESKRAIFGEERGTPRSRGRGGRAPDRTPRVQQPGCPTSWTQSQGPEGASPQQR